MDSTEIDRIANDVVRTVLTYGLEFSDVYEHDDCADASQGDLRAIHARASSTLRKLAAQFQDGDTE
ncbi:hypothetical protein [Nocardia abscessus]|uniref:hypothetical protein n=1 Tax=Nocardia abscessus TaxID=120957 RepID=UPI0002D46C99|nr:hypothetical protein [Nocardia abscessus]MCC3333557.1 hypothetical protein [Nocardia abscessus]